MIDLKTKADLQRLVDEGLEESLNEAMLAHLQIALPDVATQISIGTILKSLDDQVDLLREMTLFD
jgi:hypothetical protein